MRSLLRAFSVLAIAFDRRLRRTGKSESSCSPSGLNRNGLRLRAALLNQLKKTATYILRCTMQLVTSPVSLSVKYPQNRSGARFAQPYLVGLQHGFRFTLA